MPVELPRILWTLWMQGWEHAPPLVRACRRSWEVKNPGWEVRALTAETVGEFIDLTAVYPSASDPDLPLATVSDLIRIELLRKYGGVWVDATVFCARPLDEWLPQRLATGFFAFRRADKHPLSSWFLAATPRHPLVRRWRKRVVRYWTGRSRRGHYYWFHRIFERICSRNPQFRELWDATPSLPAEGPHYFVPQAEHLARAVNDEDKLHVAGRFEPVLKLSHKVGHEETDPSSVYAYLCDAALRPAPPLPEPPRWSLIERGETGRP